MGAWSASILGNDTSADVYDYFKRMYLYQEGADYKWSVSQVADSLITFYYPTIKDISSEKCNVYFILALSLWERGELTPGILKIVHDLIYDKVDYEAWKELEASEKTLKQRWAATTAFYEKIKTPNPAPKKRELKPAKVSVYRPGDCLAYKFGDNYYGLLVGDDGRNVDDGSNNFVFVNIKTKTLPTLLDFAESKFMANEDLLNHFNGTESDYGAVPPVAFSFRFGKGAVKKMQRSFIHIGKLPFSWIFFQSSFLRFSPISTKHKSVEEMMKQALEFWSQKSGTVSEYKVQYDCLKKLDTKKADRGELMVGDRTIPFKDILVEIDNSIWHINVCFFVKGWSKNDVEVSWIWFAQLIEYLTGRQINQIELYDQDTGLEPLDKIDFKKYKLKHVEDPEIVYTEK